MKKLELNDKAGEILQELEHLLNAAKEIELTPSKKRKLTVRIAAMQDRLELLTRRIDPNQLPDAFFDPAEPALIGNFVALALIAQNRKPLKTLPKFYGSGVYAIYYTGENPLYAPISGTETPIYVGKADPEKGNPKTPIDQGTKLAGRLNEHRRNIEKVSGIDIEDFECRALAVQTGYQSAAESHLIKMFKPVWNNETKVLFGIGKHGDKSTTRANNRSPFDTVHPGRAWAEGNPVARSADEIIDDVTVHFRVAPIFFNKEQVFSAFVENMRRDDRIEPQISIDDLI